jgi:hypothetical protein
VRKKDRGGREREYRENGKREKEIETVIPR